MLLDACMDEFICASRGLFNTYFREASPWEDPHRAWDRRDLYKLVEAPLFRTLVTVRCELPEVPYGSPQVSIGVCGRHDNELPAMINRGIDSGYWDFPLELLPLGVRLHFLSFFDWANIERMDHGYVRAIIDTSNDIPELLGKHCLIKTHDVRFERPSDLPNEA